MCWLGFSLALKTYRSLDKKMASCWKYCPSLCIWVLWYMTCMSFRFIFLVDPTPATHIIIDMNFMFFRSQLCSLYFSCYWFGYYWTSLLEYQTLQSTNLQESSFILVEVDLNNSKILLGLLIFFLNLFFFLLQANKVLNFFQCSLKPTCCEQLFGYFIWNWASGCCFVSPLPGLDVLCSNF